MLWSVRMLDMVYVNSSKERAAECRDGFRQEGFSAVCHVVMMSNRLTFLFAGEFFLHSLLMYM